MTRAEELAIKQERNRKEYEARKEAKKAYSREWYRKNKDYFRLKTAARREKQRKDAEVKKHVIKPSIESIEEQLPYELRKDKYTLRRKFLKIPIHERPTYDIYLRLKTAEYYKRKSNIL